jgi:hypothetical protein
MGDEGTTSEHKGWSLLTGSPLPAVLVIVGVGAVIGLMLSIGRSSSAGAESFGVIYVDSPEVNTRERLLNDRLVQEQWLNAELARTDREFGVQGVHDRSEASGIHAGASFAGPASRLPRSVRHQSPRHPPRRRDRPSKYRKSMRSATGSRSAKRCGASSSRISSTIDTIWTGARSIGSSST